MFGKILICEKVEMSFRLVEIYLNMLLSFINPQIKENNFQKAQIFSIKF